MNILVTGGAGFIGSSLIDKLLKDKGNYILSVDNFDDFYSKEIKLLNQVNHYNSENFQFYEFDIRNIDNLKIDKKIDCVVHLAAKAGVRPSVSYPLEFFDVNVNGTIAMLEFAKKNNIKQFVFASSSSVYGINKEIPWKECQLDLLPISPYATSKLACENIGFTYSHLYNVRFVGLRFFTVFGPRQRPDLAINKFFNHILNNIPIDVYGDGNTFRDYTYIDDVVSGIISAMKFEKSNFEIFNIGNNNSMSLINLIKEIGDVVEKPYKINYINEQIGDVPKTCADIDKSSIYLGYNPKTSLKDGLKSQLKWLKSSFYD